MKKLCFLSLVVFAFSFFACAITRPFSTVTLDFQSIKDINDGALLPVDIVTVEKSVSDSVLEIGPDNWFGNGLRDRLTGEEIKHLAIKGGSTRQVKIKVPSEVEKIIIYADYENNIDRAGQQVVILPARFNFLPIYKINLKESKMETAE